MSSSEAAEAKRRVKSHKKALRCLTLFERGHDLRAISELCNIPSGSVQKRIDLGRRLRSLESK